MKTHHLPAIENLINNPFLFCEILCVYKSLLSEQKSLHEINCPECEKQDKPCKKYYWLVLDRQEIAYAMTLLMKEMKQL